MPKICIGLFTFNEERHIAEAIDSLLAQTVPDFHLIVLDDCSTDSTKEILGRYAESDTRISLHHHSERMGYVANYRRTFALADPQAEYFAWAAGHDRHHPQWLEKMLQAFDDYPDAVLAYPQTVRISDGGDTLPFPSPMFDTTGMNVRQRIAALRSSGAGFGNMIYGLFQADAVRRAGVFPRTLLPDTNLLWRLALLGAFVQVKEDLWFRRFRSDLDIERQRRVAFANPPRYTGLPWQLVNTIAIAWATVFGPRAGGTRDRWHGAQLSAAHMVRYGHALVPGGMGGRFLLWPCRAARRLADLVGLT